MSYPSFNVGEVLTAADMNAVGLWLVKTQTIGTAVSSVTVTGAFSADYDNYKIIITGGTNSTPQAISFKLGASTTGYYGALLYLNYGANSIGNLTNNNAAAWAYVGEGLTDSTGVNIELLSPFLTKFTRYFGGYSGSIGGMTSGYHAVATSYTDFTISVGGTMTGGTIRVYGYRN
jgi:hypothetical protein